MREADPSLRFQATIELRQRKENRVAKIGSNVFSYHLLAPYPGWDSFRREIGHELSYLVKEISDFRAIRLGFRYINLLNEEDHKIASVADLSYKISQSNGTRLAPPYNLHFIRTSGDNHIANIKMSSPDFVTGAPNVPYRALVDIDVGTPAGFASKSLEDILDWMESAHGFEKREFFSLIPGDVLDAITEEWEGYD
jgi:uncharacterized protein (TIGR04255 family)